MSAFLTSPFLMSSETRFVDVLRSGSCSRRRRRRCPPRRTGRAARSRRRRSGDASLEHVGLLGWAGPPAVAATLDIGDHRVLSGGYSMACAASPSRAACSLRSPHRRAPRRAFPTPSRRATRSWGRRAPRRRSSPTACATPTASPSTARPADLVMGDVGRGNRRRWTGLPRPAPGAQNFGWPCTGGVKAVGPPRGLCPTAARRCCRSSTTARRSAFGDPGGYVVRDPSLSSSRPATCSPTTSRRGALAALQPPDPGDRCTGLTLDTGQLGSFGQDAAGHLYATEQDARARPTSWFCRAHHGHAHHRSRSPRRYDRPIS